MSTKQSGENTNGGSAEGAYPKCTRIRSTADTQSSTLTAPTDGTERLAEERMPRELPAIIAGLDSKALMEVIVLAPNELRHKDTSNKCTYIKTIMELKFDDDGNAEVEKYIMRSDDAASDAGDRAN